MPRAHEELRVFCASIDSTGHVLPLLALARELRLRGAEVTVLAAERWRDAAERNGLCFWREDEEPQTPPDGDDSLDAAARFASVVVEASMSMAPRLAELKPSVVVTDTFTVPPALAGEVAGARVATLVPDPLYVPEPGLPVFAQGLQPPRSAVGRGAWRALWPLVNLARRPDRRFLDDIRAELGLGPAAGLDATISPELAMIATFPQLEYRRSWPTSTHVTGPMLLDLAGDSPRPPEGDEPLVVVVPSTTDLQSRAGLVATALDALAGEPLRVLATLSRPGERWEGPTPANARVVDWMPLGEALGEASLVVCHGGHGTVASSLAAGVPVLVCAAGGNTSQTGARVTWAGAGLMIPRRLTAVATLRPALRRLLNDPRFAARAEEIAAWGRRHRGPERGAELIEDLGADGS